jgi:protein tyrosine/serine phosphatase
LRSTVTFRPHRDGSAERALGTLADVSLHPIYIHCELGRDRVGLIAALYRVRFQGWRPQAAYAEMKCFGFRSYLRGLERYFWNSSGTTFVGDL